MPNPHVKPAADRSHVRALARGLEILKALGEMTSDGATLSGVAAVVNLDRATARRFLLTLTELGYVRTNGKQFFLSPKVLELGYAYFTSMPVWERVQPLLNAISESQQGAVSIGVFDGKDVVYVARAQNRRSVYTLNVSVGSRFPIYSSSIGRVLLAGMTDDEVKAILKRGEIVKRTPKTRTKMGDLMDEIARVRKQGYAIADEETEMGVRSIAVPIVDPRGCVVAGLNASVQSSVADGKELVHDSLPLLRRAVEQIEAAIRAGG